MGRFWNHQRESIERLTKKGVFFQQINCWIVGLPKFLTKVTGTATTTRHFLVVHLCIYGHFVFVFLNCFQILSSVATQPVPLYFLCLSHFFQLIVDCCFWGPVIWIPIGFPEKWIRACVGPKPPNHPNPQTPNTTTGRQKSFAANKMFHRLFLLLQRKKMELRHLGSATNVTPPEKLGLGGLCEKRRKVKKPIGFPWGRGQVEGVGWLMSGLLEAALGELSNIISFF